MIARIWQVKQEGDRWTAVETIHGTRNCDVWYNGELTGRTLEAYTLEALREKLNGAPYWAQMKLKEPPAPPEGVIEQWW